MPLPNLVAEKVRRKSASKAGSAEWYQEENSGRGANVRTAVMTPPVNAAGGVAAQPSHTSSAKPRLMPSAVCVASVQTAVA